MVPGARRRAGRGQGGIRLSLDESSWPIVHGTRESLDQTLLSTPSDAQLSFWNSQDQAGALLSDEKEVTSTRAMPTPEEVMDFLLHNKRGPFPPNFSMEDANPVSVISEKVSDTEQRLWTSGFKNVLVFRQVEGKPGLELLSRYDHGQFDFRFHGSYAFTAANETATSFLVAMKDKLFRYSYVKEEEGEGYKIRADEALLRVPSGKDADSDSDSGYDSDSESDEEEEEEWRAAAKADDGDDDESNYLVALTLSTDGSVLVASKVGNVTALVEDPETGGLVAVDTLRLLDHVQTDSIHISNSISVHKEGIYIVTQEEMVRVDLDPDTQKLAFRWSTRYGPDRPWYTSRLGPGSGSTPTITDCGGREVVVITDGELDMGIIYYDIETGKELARSKVDFGPGVGRTTSEQSVAVRGCQAFVVNNYIGVDGIDEDTFCSYFEGKKVEKELGRFCSSLQPDFIAKVCPAVFGCLGYGAAMYALEQQADGSYEVRRQWARDDLSCGTSIPLIANPQPPAQSITFCVGMKRNESLWSLMGLDTDTGADVLHFPFYKERLPSLENFFANPYFAGVEAIGKGALAIGSIGGVSYISTTTTTTETSSTSSSAITMPDSQAWRPLLDPPAAGGGGGGDSSHTSHVWWTPQSSLLAVVGIMGVVGVLVAAAVAGYRYGRRSAVRRNSSSSGRSTGGGNQEGDREDVPYLRIPTEEVWELRQQGFLF